MEGVTKALDKAMSSMDLEKVLTPLAIVTHASLLYVGECNAFGQINPHHAALQLRNILYTHFYKYAFQWMKIKFSIFLSGFFSP